MNLNADFSQRALLHGEEMPWQASPMPGVERRMLDRIGDEVARATSIVRYAPNSRFAAHTHGGGEEFIVLEGVFQDEHGDFPMGTYVRNPPGSSHTPGSDEGCVIFVKLWQFRPEDRTHIRTETRGRDGKVDPERPGVHVLPLFEDEREEVRLERYAAGARAQLNAEGGAELFVLDGAVTADGEPLRRHSWLRVPLGSRLDLEAEPEGAELWIKTGHLRHMWLPDAYLPVTLIRGSTRP